MNPHRIDRANIVVTGGAGFIGSHLVKALSARGAAKITVIDSLRYGKRENLPADVPVDVVRHDLGFGEVAELDRALEGADYLFHLAAEKHNQSKDEPTRVLRSNVEGTAALFGAAARAKVKKIIFTSSLYAYGRLVGEPMIETELPMPRTVYGISKLTGEHLLAFYGREHGIDWNVLRLFFIYGPRQFAGTGYKSVIVKSIERLIAGQAPIVYGDGEQTLDYLYVDDMVEAACLALEKPLSGEVLNVGSGIGTSVNTLIDEIIDVSGKTIRPEAGPADWTHGSRRIGDPEKTARLLGWRAKTPLGSGLSATYDWILPARGLSAKPAG